VANTTTKIAYKYLKMEEKQQKVLEELGLSMNEAKIYRSLLKLKEASVPKIALDTGVNKRNIYDTMPKLENKGLVFQVLGNREVRYGPVDPNRLKSIIKEKEARLEDILPKLSGQFHKDKEKDATFIYQGQEGLKSYMRDMIDSGEDIYTIGAKGTWFIPGNEEFVKKFVKDAKKKKMTFNHIFDYEMKALGDSFPLFMTDKYKFLPKEYSSAGAINIYGDKVIMFSGVTIKKASEDISFTVIQDSDLAEAYRIWFRFMWDNIAED